MRHAHSGCSRTPHRGWVLVAAAGRPLRPRHRHQCTEPHPSPPRPLAPCRAALGPAVEAARSLASAAAAGIVLLASSTFAHIGGEAAPRRSGAAAPVVLHMGEHVLDEREGDAAGCTAAVPLYIAVAPSLAARLVSEQGRLPLRSVDQVGWRVASCVGATAPSRGAAERGGGGGGSGGMMTEHGVSNSGGRQAVCEWMTASTHTGTRRAVPASDRQAGPPSIEPDNVCWGACRLPQPLPSLPLPRQGAGPRKALHPS